VNNSRPFAFLRFATIRVYKFEKLLSNAKGVGAQNLVGDYVILHTALSDK